MGQWVKAAKKAEIPDDTGKLVTINGKSIALFKNGGRVHAIHPMCPHQGGPLEEGGMSGANVICPWHGWEFELTTGQCTFNKSIRVPVYPVKEEGEDVLVEA